MKHGLSFSYHSIALSIVNVTNSQVKSGIYPTKLYSVQQDVNGLLPLK